MVSFNCLGLVSTLYEKYVIDTNGHMVRTDYPIECYLGWHWAALEWRESAQLGTLCVAYSKEAGQEPYNLYWESVRNPDRMPRLRGTVVVLMWYQDVKLDWVYHGMRNLPKREKSCVVL
jgi:hypothetical protein